MTTPRTIDAHAPSAVPAHRLEPLLNAALAGAAALAVALGPAGGDVSAHLYRTLLVQHGVYLWDNLWFAGQYPLVSYSLLYYPVAATIGNVTLVAGSVIAAAVLFGRIAVREWGRIAVWPSRIFAVLVAGPMFTGTYAYAAGFATLLATVAALQSGRISLAVACGALTLGFSPLAFVFLVIVLAAVAVGRGRVNHRAGLFCGGLAAAAAVEFTALRIFPTSGEYPFRWGDLARVVVVGVLGVVVAWRALAGRVLAALFGCWTIACVILFFIPEPVGANATRLSSVVFPLMLLTVLVARFRPHGIAPLALAIAFAYNIFPYGPALANRTNGRASEPSFWTPALRFLHEHREGAFRVEVVPTADHWEAWFVPGAGFALARGWYRQLDVVENGVLYRPRLSSTAYRAWLRRMAVRYVMLPSVALDKNAAYHEAWLVRHRTRGLRLVFHSHDWRIYTVIDPLPILRGPGRVHFGAFKHDQIAARVTKPGFYYLAVHFMPYWKAKGDICVERARDGMTQVVVGSPGGFVLSADNGPGALITSAFGARNDSAYCG